MSIRRQVCCCATIDHAVKPVDSEPHEPMYLMLAGRHDQLVGVGGWAMDRITVEK
jgi:hypothetical protein